MPWSCSTIFFSSLLFNCIFLSVFFFFFAPLPGSVLLLLYLCQRMPQTKPRQDHTKRRQSVEDQAPYGEHINNKACGTHSRRAPSHLHMPLICIFTKRPLWLSPHQQTPPHSLISARRFDYGKAGRQAGNVCRLGPHTRTSRWRTNTHKCTKINFCTRGIQMCNGRVNREIRKRVSEIWWCEHWPCSSNFHPSFSPLPPPPPPLLSSLSPLIIRYLVTSGPW